MLTFASSKREKKGRFPHELTCGGRKRGKGRSPPLLQSKKKKKRNALASRFLEGGGILLFSEKGRRENDEHGHTKKLSSCKGDK